MQGLGSTIVSWISESPVVVAGNAPVVTITVLAVAGVVEASMLRQLTMPRKVGDGLAPVETSTSPRTLISSSPSALSLPWARGFTHAAPAPATPWMGLVAPVNGGV